MQHRIVRKGLVVGIIAILILVCLPQNVGAEGLPDLVIEDIRKDIGSSSDDVFFAAKVKNVGDAPSGNLLDFNVKVTWMFLGKIPIRTEFSQLIPIGIGNLFPGDSQYLPLLFKYEISSIRFGTYSFEFTVNPNQSIEESQYFNNSYSEMFYVVNWFWFNQDLINQIFN